MKRSVQNKQSSEMVQTHGKWLSWVFASLLSVYAGLVIFGPWLRGERDEWSLTWLHLWKRASVLEGVEDAVARERYCIPLSAYGRQIDAAIPKDARVFVMGVLGEAGRRNLGYYSFFYYYLFPRHVSASVGMPPTFGYLGISGCPPESPASLLMHGYTHLIIADENGRLHLRALSRSPAREEGNSDDDR